MVASPEMIISDFVTHYYPRNYHSRAAPEHAPLPLKLSADVSEWLIKGFRSGIFRTGLNSAKSIEVTTSLGRGSNNILEEIFKHGSYLRNSPALLTARKEFYYLHPGENGGLVLSHVNSFPIKHMSNGDLKLINYNGLGGVSTYIQPPDNIIVLPPQEV